MAIAAIAALIIALPPASLPGRASAPPGEDYPNRPITLIVPFAPGGGNDTLARLLAEHMGRALGQPIAIEHRAGAGGSIGTRQVARAAPDGYTLLIGHSGVLGVAPSLYPDAGYDPRRDFAPVGLIASLQYAVAVNPNTPFHSMADYIAAARREPGKVNYASAGVGSASHVSTELLAAMAGVRITHVPYRGSGPALHDVANGNVSMHMAPIPALMGLIRAGGVRAIGVSGPQRSSAMPDVPTVGEKAVPGYEAVLHYGLLAPAGTPRVVVERLNTALRAALDSDVVHSRIIDDGGEPLPSTPEEHATDIDRQETKWGALVRRLGLKAE